MIRSAPCLREKPGPLLHYQITSKICSDINYFGTHNLPRVSGVHVYSLWDSIKQGIIPVMKNLRFEGQGQADCWVDLQSVHGFRCYDNGAPNAKCQWVLVLAVYFRNDYWMFCSLSVLSVPANKLAQCHSCREVRDNEVDWGRSLPSSENFKLLMANGNLISYHLPTFGGSAIRLKTVSAWQTERLRVQIVAVEKSLTVQLVASQCNASHYRRDCPQCRVCR